MNIYWRNNLAQIVQNCTDDKEEAFISYGLLYL